MARGIGHFPQFSTTNLALRDAKNQAIPDKFKHTILILIYLLIINRILPQGMRRAHLRYTEFSIQFIKSEILPT